MFSPKYISGDLKSYRKWGLDKRAQVLVDYLKAQDFSEYTVLEVGCGIGALQVELMKTGASRGLGLDISIASVEAATQLAERLALQDRLVYRQLDFTQEESEIGPADIVVLDRVVCCYPDMEGLVRPAAQHARQLCAVVYPRTTWWVRLGGFLFNGYLWALRRTFRFFLHDPRKIADTVLSQGFDLDFSRTFGPWQISVFRKQTVSPGK